MGDPEVAIGDAELNRIGEYVQSHLPEWMDKLGIRPTSDPVTNSQLLERIVGVEEQGVRLEGRVVRLEERIAGVHERVVRVDEELRAQREIMTSRFAVMDERFVFWSKSANDPFCQTMRNLDSIKWLIASGTILLVALYSLLTFLA